MGYKSRIYIVSKGTRIGGVTPETENMRVGWVIAMFDLCKMSYDGPFHKIIESCPETDCYIYVDDENKPTIEDKYGDRLREIPLKSLRCALMLEDQGYHRISPLVAILSEFLDDSRWQHGGIVALHYGY